MKKTEDAPRKRSLLISLIAAILLLTGGYFGNSFLEEQNQEEYNKQQQETEKDLQESLDAPLDISEDISNTLEDTSGEVSENAITYYFRSDKLWQDHYEKHGIEMGFDSPEDYLLAANKVIKNENVLHKPEEEDGDDVYYLEETNEFVIVSTDGYLRTYFNPNDGIRYFNRQ